MGGLYGIEISVPGSDNHTHANTVFTEQKQKPPKQGNVLGDDVSKANFNTSNELEHKIHIYGQALGADATLANLNTLNDLEKMRSDLMWMIESYKEAIEKGQNSIAESTTTSTLSQNIMSNEDKTKRKPRKAYRQRIFNIPAQRLKLTWHRKGGHLHGIIRTIQLGAAHGLPPDWTSLMDDGHECVDDCLLEREAETSWTPLSRT